MLATLHRYRNHDAHSCTKLGLDLGRAWEVLLNFMKCQRHRVDTASMAVTTGRY